MNRRRPVEKVGDVLESLLSQKGLLSACREWDVVHKWPQFAGERIAAVTSATRCENGTLYVQVATAPWRQELTYVKQQLLSAIQVKCATITDIVFY
jgi:predicted nucleic acid-binding Zn ribbon protein